MSTTPDLPPEIKKAFLDRRAAWEALDSYLKGLLGKRVDSEELSKFAALKDAYQKADEAYLEHWKPTQ